RSRWRIPGFRGLRPRTGPKLLTSNFQLLRHRHVVHAVLGGGDVVLRLRAEPLDGAVLGEPALGVDGGHAAGAGGGDGLAVDVVLRVAAGEDAGDVGVGRARARLDVAGLVHVEPAAEDGRVG